MKKEVLKWIIPSLFFVSCSSVGHLQTEDVTTNNLPKTDSEKILVYSTKPNQNIKFDVLGQVIACADAGQNTKISVDLLKKEAALLGADAIIDLRLEIGMGNWSNSIKASGTAVKIK
ncbi:heavy metal-binding domain-containing protein [Flavobacterium daejeonense]|uniref:heavy metal-binding domain-containing protein n=1 Tax=Flavobacterium daejeonense TaxID=350893 RepID=UPI00047BE303|nr:heavy metal-binding domain-containing protein [Flavobacterium daejeonense]